MTKEELDRLEKELNEERERSASSFERWYDMAKMTSVRDNCELGWLLGRLRVRASEMEQQPVRQVEASVTINAKGGPQAG